MKKRWKKKRHMNQDMVLQITSMADIFTILLVFLLKSTATGASNITPSSNMTLPEVQKPAEMIETLKLEISEGSILMDEKPILTLQHFQFSPTDLDTLGLPNQLNTALAQQRSKDTLEKFPKMLILADQATPYSTLKRVLASAATNGFVDYKLVVVEDQ